MHTKILNIETNKPHKNNSIYSLFNSLNICIASVKAYIRCGTKQFIYYNIFHLERISYFVCFKWYDFGIFAFYSVYMTKSSGVGLCNSRANSLFLSSSFWKTSSQLNMVKSPSEPKLEYCLVTQSESISISWWSIWLNLVFKKLTQFLLKVRPFAFLWWRGGRGGRWGWWWRRRWGWCTITPRCRIYFWI